MVCSSEDGLSRPATPVKAPPPSSSRQPYDRDRYHPYARPTTPLHARPSPASPFPAPATTPGGSRVLAFATPEPSPSSRTRTDPSHPATTASPSSKTAAALRAASADLARRQGLDPLASASAYTSASAAESRLHSSAASPSAARRPAPPQPDGQPSTHHANPHTLARPARHASVTRLSGLPNPALSPSSRTAPASRLAPRPSSPSPAPTHSRVLALATPSPPRSDQAARPTSNDYAPGASRILALATPGPTRLDHARPSTNDDTRLDLARPSRSNDGARDRNTAGKIGRMSKAAFSRVNPIDEPNLFVADPSARPLAAGPPRQDSAAPLQTPTAPLARPTSPPAQPAASASSRAGSSARPPAQQLALATPAPAPSADAPPAAPLVPWYEAHPRRDASAPAAAPPPSAKKRGRPKGSTNGSKGKGSTASAAASTAASTANGKRKGGCLDIRSFIPKKPKHAEAEDIEMQDAEHAEEDQPGDAAQRTTLHGESAAAPGPVASLEPDDAAMAVEDVETSGLMGGRAGIEVVRKTAAGVGRVNPRSATAGPSKRAATTSARAISGVKQVKVKQSKPKETVPVEEGDDSEDDCEYELVRVHGGWVRVNRRMGSLLPRLNDPDYGTKRVCHHCKAAGLSDTCDGASPCCNCLARDRKTCHPTDLPIGAVDEPPAREDLHARLCEALDGLSIDEADEVAARVVAQYVADQRRVVKENLPRGDVIPAVDDWKVELCLFAEKADMLREENGRERIITQARTKNVVQGRKKLS